MENQQAKPPDLRVRARAFALRIVRLCDALSRSRSCDVIGRQLPRSGTSIGANYRAACRSRSAAEFLAKLGIVEEEADETVYWGELLMDSGAVRRELLTDLHAEAGEIVAMVVASIRTARDRRKPRVR
jgi:four helix bundle protein